MHIGVGLHNVRTIQLLQSDPTIDDLMYMQYNSLSIRYKIWNITKKKNNNIDLSSYPSIDIDLVKLKTKWGVRVSAYCWSAQLVHLLYICFFSFDSIYLISPL